MAGVKRQTRMEKAAGTRRRMLDAAYGLFVEQGFRATTMDAIAMRAGVAVQTLYFTFHTKDDLLQAVQDRAVLGDGDPVPPPRQPWHEAMLAAPRIGDSVRHFVTGIDEITSRVAPLLPALHEVAGDPAGDVWRRSEALRREGFGEIVHAWIEKAPLRAGLSEARAVDLLLLIGGPEVYRQLVVLDGWSREEYRGWLRGALLRELFGKRSSPD